MVYIGINLGTTYSCVSVIEDGKPVVIVSDDGRSTIPSAVAYCESGILVGHPALSCNTDPSNILYDSKRLIGWKFLANLPIAGNRNLWTFNVDTRDDFCGYVLNKGKPNERFIKAEEVSAEILKSLKAAAEILVGGSTRIPKIQELLSHKFGQTRLRYNVNPEEAVAHGAAIIADALELLMDGMLIRYIDYQTMNRNGLKLERFQKDEIYSESRR
ncbi:hypothetical protein WR25_06395 [Diploscapter pachys]|uniref:Uncharacterized protein n=1 Tax=Diploscapter pachys TaxID=2018661 RepID=A0A2A2LYZ1_9BILA|nr:hypothetical protein WR25_06395 [Diploscapter pachys]